LQYVDLHADVVPRVHLQNFSIFVIESQSPVYVVMTTMDVAKSGFPTLFNGMLAYRG
jgi:hypothetical protein